MLLRYLALFPLLLLTACQAGHMHLGNPEHPYAPPHEPQVGDILHLPTGIYVEPQALFDHASRARVVYIGETHDNPAAHQVQLDVLEAVEAHNPGKVSLAMEMFSPNQQEVLDRWVAGELSEKDFLKEVNWFNNWRMNFALYKPLLDFAREKQIPVIALNVDKALQRKVGMTPFEDLSEEERQQLPEMEVDPYQVAATQAFYSGHKMGKAAEDGFQRVQTLWDETMAENLADYLKSDAGEGRQVVVVAGGNHVRYGYGIPRRVFRRTQASYLLIGSHEIDVPEEKQDRVMDIEMPQFPMPAYHFLVYTRYEDLPEQGVKLGIMLEGAEGGLKVLGVIPGSTAQEVGLQEGDLLTTLDGSIKLEDPYDLIYELHQKKVGDQISLELQRDGERITVPVEFKQRESKHHGMK